MYDDELVKLLVQNNHDQKVAIKQLKIKSIHKDIIRLKQENRNIGDKVRSLFCHVSDNDCKAFTCTKTESYTYIDRIKRDLTTIEYLRKLQEYNSKLINKHRSKIKSLRSELQELKKELSVLKGEKE